MSINRDQLHERVENMSFPSFPPSLPLSFPPVLSFFVLLLNSAAANILHVHFGVLVKHSPRGIRPGLELVTTGCTCFLLCYVLRNCFSSATRMKASTALFPCQFILFPAGQANLLPASLLLPKQTNNKRNQESYFHF
jgi:hypothetical protein